MQQGLDMLVRLNKPNEVFSFLMKADMFAKAVVYSLLHNINIKKIEPNVVDKFKRMAMENRRVVDNYIEEHQED